MDIEPIRERANEMADLEISPGAAVIIGSGPTDGSVPRLLGLRLAEGAAVPVGWMPDPESDDPRVVIPSSLRARRFVNEYDIQILSAAGYPWPLR